MLRRASLWKNMRLVLNHFEGGRPASRARGQSAPVQMFYNPNVPDHRASSDARDVDASLDGQQNMRPPSAFELCNERPSAAKGKQMNVIFAVS